MDNRCYAITSRVTGAQVLIDAADSPADLRRLLAAGAADVPAHAPAPHLALIATTHQHWDHVRALRELAEETGCHTVAGTLDADGIAEQAGLRPAQELTHGDTIRAEDIVLTAIHLRGHTPGSIAYVLAHAADTAQPHTDGSDDDVPHPPRSPSLSGPIHIFSGDSLFPGGVGNTWGDAAAFRQLLDDVAQRLFAIYPDSTVILPGHGEWTTLGAERPHLEEWHERGW